MSDLSYLYQEILLEHNSKPRNFRVLDGHTVSVEGYNPLCGDQYTLYLTLQEDTIDDISFQGAGCAISKASTSMLTERVKGKTKQEAVDVFNEFHSMITNPGSDVDSDLLEDLETLSGISEYPTRIKCAILSWHALREALDGASDSVSTE
ncbi:MAG: SUF system NifU family Fe-S cluster assembly protein [Chloroflexota bacterium]|nr:SUF system NifU family Fe-S cluster assembly protein [Chloroflexota bacterium]